MRRKTESLEKESITNALKGSVDYAKSLEGLTLKERQKKKSITKVMTYTLNRLTQQFMNREFEWLLPVIFSRTTDPLWPDPNASIEKRIEIDIYGKTVRTTTSMIIHKMVACSLVCPKLFTISPNIRIERRDRADSRMHAYEFSQLDFEVRNATSREIRALVEETLVTVITELKGTKIEDSNTFKGFTHLKTPLTPFQILDKNELETNYGKTWEKTLIEEISDPVWITNIPREFYDYEDFETNSWDNYDLLVPKYGEILSGSKREWNYEKIVRKMERDEIVKENYKVLLNLAKEGRIVSSAGAGIGIERLVSWLAGTNHIGETQLFPKIPGTVNYL